MSNTPHERTVSKKTQESSNSHKQNTVPTYKNTPSGSTIYGNSLKTRYVTPIQVSPKLKAAE